MDQQTRNRRLFIAALTVSALALATSDTLYANYFKEVYHVTAAQRGFLEIPRETPGFLCVFILSALSFFGENRIVVLAQALMLIGILVLGLVTPPFGVMMIFLFINSLGMHISMPLQDSLGMRLAEPDKVGTRMGQYNAFKTAASMVMGLLVTLAFRVGLFSFEMPIKTPFVVAAGLFAISFVLFAVLAKNLRSGAPARRQKPVFRKEYITFYLLALLRGIEKQVVFVFAPWILIELLGQRSDTTSLLTVISAGIGIGFLPMLGKLVDRIGVKKLLLAETIGFAVVYVCYGVLSQGIIGGQLGATLGVVILACVLLTLDKMLASMGMVRTIYLRRIARDPGEVTSVLATGLSLDHIITISCAYFGGYLWDMLGPQWVFFLSAGIVLLGLIIVLRMPRDEQVHRA